MTSRELDPIIQLLKKEKRIQVALVFGSFATGKTHPGSDIDLAVASERKMSDAEYLDLLGKLSLESNRKIDLIDLHKAHPPLSTEILKNPMWIKRDGLILSKILSRTLAEKEDYLPLKSKLQEKKIKRFIDGR